jgi:hypothetical protein
VALAGMNDGQTCFASGLEQPSRRRYGLGQQRDVIAERCAKAARLKEVPLHVYDHEAGLRVFRSKG